MKLPGDLGDVAWWGAEGVAGSEYLNMDKYEYYFYFHHTNADYMTIFNRDDIDYVAAVFASVAFMVSDVDQF